MPPFLNLFFGIFFALLPALVWLTVWYKKDSAEPEPKRMLVLAFLFGMLAVIPFFVMRWQFEHSPNLELLWESFSSAFLYLPAVIMVIFFAFLEEALKHFAALRLGKHLHIHFNQIVDGIIYSVAAALGFAFAENIFFFLTLLKYYDFSNPEFWNVVAFRAVGTTLGHSIFSGVFGLFWGHAFLSKKVTQKHTFSVSRFFLRLFDTFRFHIIFSHILRARPSFRGHEKGDLVREALLLATLLHSAFNLLVQFEAFGAQLTPLLAPFLLLSFLFLSRQFLIPKNIEILKPIV